MPRYKITIEYDGTGLAGWQAQPEKYSVQEALEAALHKFCGEQAEVIGAGRTDAGVHAYNMAAHFEVVKELDASKVAEGLNFYLRKDSKLPVPYQISVTGAGLAEADFHARFNAKMRYYEYKIVNRRGHLALDNLRAWAVHEKMDAEKMHDAAQILVGRHDWSSFRSSECQAKDPVKSLAAISVERQGENIIIKCNGISFLHHQVRNIVGTLKYVGIGKWTKDDLQRILAAKDRTKAGPTAPAQGLYFVKVEY